MRTKNLAAILLLSIAAGFILQAAIYLIPVEWMEEEKVESAKIMDKSLTAPQDPASGRIIDNYADSVTLAMATYSGDESVLEKAVASYYIEAEGLDPREAFVETTLHHAEGQLESYARYWHGSLVFVKPLLTVLNISEIRKLNAICLIVLIMAVLLILQKKLPECTIPFILMMMLAAPSAIGQCLEFSGAFYVMLGTVLMLLCSEIDTCAIFLISGICMAYFDFLTAPTIALTVPLTVLCMLKRDTRMLLFCILAWFAGYGGMWSGKWILALLVQRGAFFQSLLDHFVLWTVDKLPESGTHISRLDTLIRNFTFLLQDYLINSAILSFLVLNVSRSIRNRPTYDQLSVCLRLYIPVLVSVSWILIMASHSYMHTFFTYRTLAPCVFAILCAAGGVFK